MKTWMMGFCLSFAVCANAQYGPGGKYLTPIPDYSAEQAEQRAKAVAEREANNREAYWQYQNGIAQSKAQQAELQKIYSKDSFRRINDTTNFASGTGWFEFQGEVQERLEDGVVFKGQWGPIFTVFPYYHDSAMVFSHPVENTIHQITSHDSSSASAGNLNATTTYGRNSMRYDESIAVNTSGRVVSESYSGRPILYGDDIFFVQNFPYPTEARQGYAEMMAYDSGYYSYTNKAGQKITIHKLDYGTPCAKVWTREERDAADPRIAAKQKAAISIIQMADRGEAYWQFRAGEIYRDGDGVRKDLIKARDYFTKAAAASYPTAADELLKLNQVIANSPATK